MKQIFKIGIVAAATFISCHAQDVQHVDVSKLTYVDENHTSLTIKNVDYILDSYIVMFEQPYYIRVRRDDGKSIEKEVAVKVAEKYIKPRGCTQPLSRRTSLDRHTDDGTEWLIGVAC